MGLAESALPGSSGAWQRGQVWETAEALLEQRCMKVEESGLAQSREPQGLK